MPIIAAARMRDPELESQCARALRNLSVRGARDAREPSRLPHLHGSVAHMPATPTPRSPPPAAENKEKIKELGGVEVLQELMKSGRDRVQSQASRALRNLGVRSVALAGGAGAAGGPDAAAGGGAAARGGAP